MLLLFLTSLAPACSSTQPRILPRHARRYPRTARIRRSIPASFVVNFAQPAIDIFRRSKRGGTHGLDELALCCIDVIFPVEPASGLYGDAFRRDVDAFGFEAA